MDNPRGAVRVRFAPSPTGYLHIGGARTVLFNWLLARKTGGAFVLRIEDTDQTRHVEDSVPKILADLRWLGLNWDEGPEAGGELGPYFQSRRLDLYNRYLQQLLESGNAYYALESPEELQAMRAAAKAAKSGFKYQRPDPLPTIEQGLAARAKGQPIAVRFKMPDTAITIVDDILGEVTLAADQLEDFVIQKGDGFPTYHFACVVDDELMKITHVLRGQEHLMNTPKHIALQRALGFATPRYAHLPVIFNMNGSKMSKRDKEKALTRGEPPPEIDVHDFRTAGYLPEAVINFIALLGWSSGEEREQFDRDELIARFSIERIGKTNARFDRAKLVAFNTDWAARVTPDRLLEAFKDYLTVSRSDTTSRGLQPARSPVNQDAAPGGTGPRPRIPDGAEDPRVNSARVPHPCAAGVGDGSETEDVARAGIPHPRETGVGDRQTSHEARASRTCEPGVGDEQTSHEAAELIFQPTGQRPTDHDLRWILSACAGFRTFQQVMEKVRFLFTPDDEIHYDPKAVAKVLKKNDGAGYAMLEYLTPKFEALDDWSAPAIEKLLQSVCAEKNTKLGNVAQPVRVAITGSTISPSIHESLAKLGRERTLIRVVRCLAEAGAMGKH